MIYNQFRPTRFSQVLGHPKLTGTLLNQSKYNLYGHSYLFAGASGCGKTTTARILAMSLACKSKTDGEPCGTCPDCRNIQRQAHWDVIEFDAATNRGIDDIRELKRRAYLSPMGKRKIYIIDECHALTPESWQAMLKLLEEPPDHLVIIMCTTKPETLPDTIISRCQRYEFAALPPETIAAKLKSIVATVKLPIDDATLRHLSVMACGNCRQAENLLEQQICVPV